MKKILVILCICLISIFSTGCNEEQTEKVSGMFTVVDDGIANKGITIYVHNETKVMYLYIDGDRKSGLTVMLDQYGKPLLWQGE